MKDDLVFFANEAIINKEQNKDMEKSWKVLIVDDEIGVHSITKLVLSEVIFDKKGLEFISAFSEKEARDIIKDNPDIAVVLLDVVMEREDSGLRIVKYIREELKNSFVRIILRTGQPGMAPEKSVIVEYDINDYKEKTELTSQKLFTTIISSLRAYRDIVSINNSKNSVEQIVESSWELFKRHSLKEFAKETLIQLNSIISSSILNPNSSISGYAAVKREDKFYIAAGIGRYVECLYEDVSPLCENFNMEFSEYMPGNGYIYTGDSKIIYHKKSDMLDIIIYVEDVYNFCELEKHFIEVFFTNVSIGIDNIGLSREIENTQKEIVFTLGEVAEIRSRETGNHVKRVAEYSRLIAKKYGLDEEEVDLIGIASPMHDVGKLGIPDSILNKPGKLTAEEFEIMKKHSIIGYDMLKKSNRDIMQTAAIIALEHHEKYDGTGYPYGLKGNNISIYGRITAIADVFDALGSSRVYKKAWSMESILGLFREERGKHFDPELVDILFSNLERIIEIKDRFKDKITIPD